MKSKEKISVIIPTHNRTQKLKKCIASLLIQRLPPYEIIIIDNSSTKSAKKTVKELKRGSITRLSYFHEQKKGSPYARNLGIKKSQGSLIAFIDDDCEANKKWLEEAVKYQKKFPQAIIMGKNLNGYSKNIYSCLEHILVQTVFQTQSYKKQKILFNHWLDTKNCLLKKSILLKHHIFFDRLFAPFSIYEDVDLAKQLEQKKVKIIWNLNMKVSHFGRIDLFRFCKRAFEKGSGSFFLKKKWNINLVNAPAEYKFLLDVKLKKLYLQHQNKTVRIQYNLINDMLKNKSPIFKIFFYLLLRLHKLFLNGGFQWEKFKLYLGSY